jgi:hypothetical protein
VPKRLTIPVHFLYSSEHRAYILNTADYFDDCPVFSNAAQHFKTLHATTGYDHNAKQHNYGIDHLRWRFTGGADLFTYVEKYPDVITHLYAHELTHALDHYIRGDYERLLKIDFGYPPATSSDWSVTAWTNEVRVLAMQCSALNCGNDNGRDWSLPGAGLLESRLKKACTGYLRERLSLTARRRLGSDDYVSAFVDHMFDYWSTRWEYLRDEFHSMISWLINETEVRSSDQLQVYTCPITQLY